MVKSRKQHKNPIIRVAVCAISGNWYMAFGPPGGGIFVFPPSVNLPAKFMRYGNI
jgi:hypothetical protein